MLRACTTNLHDLVFTTFKTFAKLQIEVVLCDYHSEYECCGGDYRERDESSKYLVLICATTYVLSIPY